MAAVFESIPIIEDQLAGLVAWNGAFAFDVITIFLIEKKNLSDLGNGDLQEPPEEFSP